VNIAIVGRIEVDGEDDLPAVHALQDGLALEPLGAGALAVGVPGPDPRVGAELEWWERFRVALGAFPPPAADAPYLRVCEQLGLGEEDTPFADLDEGRTAVLVEGARAGQAKIEELMRQLRTTPEGWQSALHAFDYNLDYLELGTVDRPEVEDRRPDAGVRHAPRCRARRAVGEPRLRGRLRRDLGRLRRQRARRGEPVRAAPRAAAAGRDNDRRLRRRLSRRRHGGA